MKFTKNEKSLETRKEQSSFVSQKSSISGKTKSFQKATIKKVELRRIDDVFKKHKPQGLGFSDNDVIILTLKKADGQTFTQDFYCRLKGDGTLGHSMTKASEKRQQNLRNFVNKYISKEKKYNVRENINKWIGKEVDIEEINGGFILKG